MEVSYKDRTFSADLQPDKKFPSIFNVIVNHYEHVKKEVKTDSVMQVTEQVDTGEKDKEGKQIFREKETAKVVTLIREELETLPVKVGSFKVYTKPSNIDLRKIVSNWLQQSGDIDKILSKYASKEEEDN